VRRENIDLIDIASPNDTHAEIAIAAAAAGKMVMCEKPLGRSPAETLKMVAAVEAAQRPNMVWYNFRRVPAVTLAKQLIDEGKLGRVFHYRGKLLQDWTISADLPQGGAALWRLDAGVAGSGVTGDLLAHCIDTAMWLNGPIDSVNGMTETFVKERTHNLTGKKQEATIDAARRSWPARQRLARHFRSGPLRARPQGAIHARNQRRERLDLMGPARSASAAIFRPQRRRATARLALGAHHRQ
jgi:predicted dehydrogenase